jgi:hypothetical protein
VARLGKGERAELVQGVRAAVRSHFKKLAKNGALVLTGVSYTEDSLVARLAEYLDTAARIRELRIALAVAVEREETLWLALLRPLGAWKALAGAAVGATSPRMRELGVRPDKQPHVSVMTKKRANEQRQETRKLRGVMGRKQRAMARKKARGE